MKFPKAEAVLRELAAKDAQFAIDFEAFLEGMLEAAPLPQDYEVSPKRAGEIAALVVEECAA